VAIVFGGVAYGARAATPAVTGAWTLQGRAAAGSLRIDPGSADHGGANDEGSRSRKRNRQLALRTAPRPVADLLANSVAQGGRSNREHWALAQDRGRAGRPARAPHRRAAKSLEEVQASCSAPRARTRRPSSHKAPSSATTLPPSRFRSGTLSWCSGTRIFDHLSELTCPAGRDHGRLTLVRHLPDSASGCVVCASLPSAKLPPGSPPLLYLYTHVFFI